MRICTGGDDLGGGPILGGQGGREDDVQGFLRFGGCLLYGALLCGVHTLGAGKQDGAGYKQHRRQYVIDCLHCLHLVKGSLTAEEGVGVIRGIGVSLSQAVGTEDLKERRAVLQLKKLRPGRIIGFFKMGVHKKTAFTTLLTNWKQS